jgi:hypothetical protein
MTFSGKAGVRIVVLLGLLGTFRLDVQAQSMSLRPTGTSGSIVGAVFDDTGKFVGGVTVAAVRIFPIQGGAGARLLTAVTDPLGGFHINNAPPASYKFCVAAPGQALLDPCLWSDAPRTWNLAGGDVASILIRLQTGSWINVRVNDPGQKAAKVEQLNGPPAFSLGVFALSGKLVDLEELARDSTGRTFRVAVPRGKNVSLVFGSNSLSAVDSQGRPATPGTAPATVAVGQADQNLELSIQ